MNLPYAAPVEQPQLFYCSPIVERTSLLEASETIQEFHRVLYKYKLEVFSTALGANLLETMGMIPHAFSRISKVRSTLPIPFSTPIEVE